MHVLRSGVGAVLAVALATNSAHAQQPRIAVGVVGALNIASVNTDLDGQFVDKEHVFGVYAGGFVGVRIAPWLTIESEAAFAQKGVKLTGDAGGFDASETFKLAYLELPLLAKFAFAPAGAALRPSIFFGPAVSVNLSCKIDSHASFGSVESNSSDSCDDFDESGGGLPDVKRVDVGLLIGASLDFGRFGVFARYEHGLLNTFDNEDDDDTSSKHRLFTTGIKIRLNR